MVSIFETQKQLNQAKHLIRTHFDSLHKNMRKDNTGGAEKLAPPVRKKHLTFKKRVHNLISKDNIQNIIIPSVNDILR